MDLNEHRIAGQRLIEAYGDMGFRLSDGRVEGSIFIFPGLVQPLDARGPDDFNEKLFQPVFERRSEIEILIIGTGEKQQFLAPELHTIFIKNNIVPELMDSRAACRTYNILRSEERQVAAALIAID